MKPALSYQKLRGGYYTQKPIAKFLSRWAIVSPKSEVLEPSCGDGAILEAILETLVEGGCSKKRAVKLVYGVELDAEERAKAIDRVRQAGFPLEDAQVHRGDFFAYAKENVSRHGLLALCHEVGRRFDAIVGNPPFVRYQHFPEDQRAVAFELMRRTGLNPSKLTNTWVPFIVASSFLLKDTGRLAMVIPAELLQVNYSAELRKFLSDFYKRITLITFKRLVFEGIQQEVVLLLAERGGEGQEGIRTIELEDASALDNYEHTDFNAAELKPMDHTTEKWTQYFLSEKEIHLLRALKEDKRIQLSGKYIDVDVGVVTGLNEFFVLNDGQLAQHNLNGHTSRIVGRSNHLKGVLFSLSDWQNNAEINLPAHLLQLPSVPLETLPKSAQEYVKAGEAQGYHTGYKCRIRKSWYTVPSVWTPDAFMLRQVHGYPKLIVNKSGATCTDTIHRVKLRNGTLVEKIAAAFLNSMTFAFSEVMGRSYGGGVLELEPNEAEKLPLPINGADDLDLDHIHKLLLKDDISAVLDITDRTLLIDGLGMSAGEAQAIRGIWQKLRDRRIYRKHTAKVGANGRSA